MKEIADKPQYYVGLLEGGTALRDVIDNHIYERTLVRVPLQPDHIRARPNPPCTPNWSALHCVLYLMRLRLCFLLQSGKNAFFVADLGVLTRQHARWRAHMAQIRPFYAVRCNSSPTVIEVLAALGTGFICTNKVQSHNGLGESLKFNAVVSTSAGGGIYHYQVLSKWHRTRIKTSSTSFCGLRCCRFQIVLVIVCRL